MEEPANPSQVDDGVQAEENYCPRKGGLFFNIYLFFRNEKVLVKPRNYVVIINLNYTRTNTYLIQTKPFTLINRACRYSDPFAPLLQRFSKGPNFILAPQLYIVS